jgi:cyclohexanecarboxylate-CoA ligase
MFDPILTRKRVEAMNAGGFWPGKTAADYLDRCIAEMPDKTAVVDFNSATNEATRLSYRDFGKIVERIAAGLAELGVEKGDVVSCQLPNWWQFTALHLACVRIGAVTNPLMPIFRERELSFMLGLAESKILVIPRAFRGFDYPAMVANIRAGLPQLKDVLVIGGDGETSFEKVLLDTPWEQRRDAGRLFAARRPDPDDVTQLMYTSGTTGEPKGVMYGLVMPILAGATAILQDVWGPKRASASISGEGITFTMASTPFLSDLTETVAADGSDVSRLRIFLVAGAPIPRALVERARQILGTNIVSAWGMTENGLVTTTCLDDSDDKAINTDGRALPGMEVQVVDSENRPLPVGEEGMLKARACSTFVGYLKRPDWYNHDAEGWFDTGDLARIDGQGYIRLTGRSKDIIIRGGENVPVVEIEDLLFRHPDIQDVAIVGVPDERLGERACAFIVPKPGHEVGLREVVAFLEEHRVARQYLPERVETVDELPRTPSGKVQKFKLREIAVALPA